MLVAIQAEPLFVLNNFFFRSTCQQLAPCPQWLRTASSFFRQNNSVCLWILYLLLLVYYSLLGAGSKLDTCLVPELKPNYSFSCGRLATSLVNYVDRTGNTSRAETERASSDALSSPTNGSLPEMSHMSNYAHLAASNWGMHHIFAPHRSFSQWWLFLISWRVSAWHHQESASRMMLILNHILLLLHFSISFRESTTLIDLHLTSRFFFLNHLYANFY